MGTRHMMGFKHNTDNLTNLNRAFVTLTRRAEVALTAEKKEKNALGFTEMKNSAYTRYSMTQRVMPTSSRCSRVFHARWGLLCCSVDFPQYDNSSPLVCLPANMMCGEM